MEALICNRSASTLSAKATQPFPFLAPETGDPLSFLYGGRRTQQACAKVSLQFQGRGLALSAHGDKTVTKLSQVTSSAGLKRSPASLGGLNVLVTSLGPQGSAGSDSAAGLDVWVQSPA